MTHLRNDPPLFDHAQVIEDRNNGYTIARIAFEQGVSTNTIAKFLKRQPVPPVAPPPPDPDALPQTFVELRDELAAEVRKQIPSMKGTALVTALKAIGELAKHEPDGGEAESDPLIADVVSGVVSLPVERKRAILTAERERLDTEAEAIDRALEVLSVA